MVEDLLYVLVGVDGRYITAQPLAGRQSRTFLVDPNLDLSIRELVNRILPVAASYSTVTRWALGLPVLCSLPRSLHVMQEVRLHPWVVTQPHPGHILKGLCVTNPCPDSALLVAQVPLRL